MFFKVFQKPYNFIKTEYRKKKMFFCTQINFVKTVLLTAIIRFLLNKQTIIILQIYKNLLIYHKILNNLIIFYKLFTTYAK